MANLADSLSVTQLSSWSEPGTHLAVLGHPIGHSLSPVMHNAALREIARSRPQYSDWRYWKIDVPPELLPSVLPVLRERKFLGINLTVPHKVLAMRLAASITLEAQQAGAMNTLKLEPEGYRGFNTDGRGLVKALGEDFSIECGDQDFLLLGAGGAARGAAVELVRFGCRSLWIGNRSAEGLNGILPVVQGMATSTSIHPFLFSTLPPDLPAGVVVINATSAGLHKDDPAPIELSQLPRPSAVYDMIYNPPSTCLLREAAKLGIPNANGLSMLIHQGALALELWTGEPVPIHAMRSALKLSKPLSTR